MPAFYKEKAVLAAAAAGLRIAGVDMIISDWEAEPAEENYIVVELNAPAMLSMHDFPYVGKNRQVEKYVLACVLGEPDRKSTRLNSSHVRISYAVFCLKKKNRRK